MKTSKKIIAILAILTIVCAAAFAVETEQTQVDIKNSGWSINAGTAYMVSHIGGAYNLGRWEFGGNLYSGFPNLAILGYMNELENRDAENPEDNASLWDYIKFSFQLAYAGNISALYDVTKSDKFDVDLGFALSGLYTDVLKDLGIRGGIVSIDLAARLKWNLNKNSGIYVATELPLAGIVMANQTNKDTNETTTSVVPFAVMTPEYFSAALVLLIYTTRIGYVYSF